MSRYVTDTHGLVWHLYGSSKLSKNAKLIFDDADNGLHQILIPAIVVVELIYLSERKRISRGAVDDVVELLKLNLGNYLIIPLDMQTVLSLQHIDPAVVPDMPDRVIAATAHRLKLPLLTRDHRIQALSNLETIW